MSVVKPPVIPRQSMRVLQVASTVALRDGGPSVVTLELTRSLGRRGHQATILSTDAEGDGRMADPATLMEQESDLRIELHRAYGPLRFKASIGLWRAIRREIRATDVVHIHGIYTFSSWAAAREATRKGVPYVIQPHGTLETYHRRKSPRKKQAFDLAVGRRMLGKAAGVVFTAESEAQAAVDLVSRERAHIVPLAASVGDGLMHEAPLQAPFVLFLGRITPKKRVDLMIQAFAEVAPRWPGILVIAGSGDPAQTTELQRLAGELLPADRVLFLGHVEGARKDWLLRNAHMFVLASECENFAISVAESLVAGTPVVVTPQVEMSKLVARFQAGVVVELTAVAVAAGMTRLIEDAELYRTAQQGAREAAAAELTWDRTAAAAEQAYSSVLS